MSQKSVEERQKYWTEEFAKFTTWEDRYKKIIALGKSMKAMDPVLQTEDAKVRGCQSQVWLHAKLNDQGGIDFEADSDAILVRGLVSLLMDIYSGAKPKEILESKTDFIKDIGFQQNLSPSRTNGLVSMIKQIKFYALAFSMKK